MIALDTNILVYARREELPQHAVAKGLLRELAEGSEPWALSWPCIYEFLRVVTHPRVFTPPTPLAAALDDVQSLLHSPSLQVLGEGPAHLSHLGRLARLANVTGNLVHDAHIAALAVEHGVQEIVTADADFARFAGLRVCNPFTA